MLPTSSTSSVSSVPRLTEGVTVSDLVLVQDINEYLFDYFYYLNERAIDAISLKDVTPSKEAQSKNVYNKIIPFVFDPNGKKILAFDADCKNRHTEVILYQENADGKLFRLTPISEKIIGEAFAMSYCRVLNHPVHRLKEYTEDELIFYLSVGGSQEDHFSFRDFESLLTKKFDYSDLGKSIEKVQLKHYAFTLSSPQVQSGADVAMVTQVAAVPSPIPDAQPTVQQVPITQVEQQPVQQPSAPVPIPAFPVAAPAPSPLAVPPPVSAVPAPAPAPVTPPPAPAATSEPKWLDVPGQNWMFMEQWNVVIDKTNGQILGTATGGLVNGQLVGTQAILKNEYVQYLASKGMHPAPGVVKVN